MKLPEQYAHVLIQAAEEKDQKGFDSFFDSFISYLDAHHHKKLLTQINSAVSRLSTSRRASNTSVVTVREEGEVERFKETLKEHEDIFGANPEIQIDPNIVGGVMIRNRTNLLDQSYRRGLLKLYETLRK